MKVAFFVTCLVDHYFAEAAADCVRLLRHLDVEVDFPEAQSCCGQPAHNAGQPKEARRMAEHTARVFEGADAVVVPSGSCAAMVKKVYPKLLGGGVSETASAAGGHAMASEAQALAEKTYELGEFLVHRLGVRELGNGLAGRTVAVHQGCHALRELRLAREPRLLLEGAGAEVVDWPAQEDCCGFGGLFSVKMTDVSAAMADHKLDALPDVDWVVSGDGGCLLHLDGRSRAAGRRHVFRHLGSALWEGVHGRP